MGKMWKYEPEDFDDNEPDKVRASHKDGRQFEPRVGNRGITNEHQFDNDGNHIQEEPKGNIRTPKRGKYDY